MSTPSVLQRAGARKLRTAIAPGRLRHVQLTAMAERSKLLAVGSILTALLILVTFWDAGPRAYMIVVSIILVALHATGIIGGRLWLARSRHDVSPRAYWLRVAVTAVVAVTWATFPTMLMQAATTDQRQLVVYAFSGLVSSSILLAPVLPAALLFASITTIGLLLPMPLLHQTITMQHVTLIILYFSMTSAIVVHKNRDFTRRVLNEFTMAEQADTIGLLLYDFEENASDWLWELDAEFRLICASDRLASLLGCEQATLNGLFAQDLLDQSNLGNAEKHDTGRLLNCFENRIAFHDLKLPFTFNGRTHWFSLTGKPVLDDAGTFQGFRGVGTDITAARRSDEQIAYLANYDSLTGLPNRVLFHDVLRRACAQAEPFAVMFLDLDEFKAVNDTLGHGIGDELIVAVAGRLRAGLRDGDVVARLGGDEFAVLHAGGDGRTIEAMAGRLISRVTEPYQLGKVSVSVGLSIGIAVRNESCATLEDLLRGADLALYHSKSAGRGTWHYFEDGMADRAKERHALQTDLRHAIDHGQLVLEYQPIVEFATDEVVGAEALVRWLHPVRGRISPADFIPIAEDSGLIIDLGRWVLRNACAAAATWSGSARVAVNLSPLQFRDPDLLCLIDQVLAESGLAPSRLELEITESVFLDAADKTVICLNALRSRGIRIALDDFGTGYSSLSYLRSFPFDKVKIDQSFVRDLGVSDDATAIVQAIVGMAGSLGMHTTGEGVETASQAILLQGIGCRQVQGYLFGRPCSAEAIAEIMQSRTAVSAAA